MSFDWHTEDEIEWEGLAEPAADTAVSPQHRWRVWLLAGVLLVAGTAVLFVARQLNQRVEAASSAVELDVQASHRVLQEAAQKRDGELFATFLSGRDPEWGNAQVLLVNQGLYLERPLFGLTWLPGSTAVVSATLSLDLQAAELAVVQAYRFDIGRGLTETARLQQTEVYRRAENRFLLSPPLAEFWGEPRQFSTVYLTLHYPARDEVWLRPLAARLEAAVAGVCAEWGADCPANFHLSLDFSISPAAFLPEEREADGLLVLPAPSLAGRPLDETGKAVLYRGYETAVTEAALRQLAGESDSLLYEAALDRILAEKGLRPWPLTPSHWQTIAAAQTALADGAVVWQGQDSPQAERLAHAIVQFLVEEQGVSSRRLLAAVVRDQALPYSIWLSAVMNEVDAAEAAAWDQFVAEQAKSG
ncbi:MAG TPA: hypothetical protein EYP41_14705 [Anaerolineae bacterium]|nr:hypothetical protein [Anaerolineae bacterium]HIP71624.1 hypothetical protein [Anaerolineae bacterium]